MDSSRALSADVCVVGGGPAGATIAKQLAGLGHSVCLIDKGEWAAGHIGVTLPPSVVPILEELSLRQRVEDAGFLRPSGTFVLWGSGTEAAFKSHEQPGFTVDRVQFDALLTAAAREAGAHIIQPGLALASHLQRDGSWRVLYRSQGEAGELRCRYLVDAAGRNHFLHDRRIRYGPATFAVYAYLRGVSVKGADAYIEARDSCWMWATPLPHRRSVAALFVDQADVPKRSRRTIETMYREYLAGSRLMRPYAEGTIISPLRVCDASPSMAAAAVGPCYIKVGEAALRTDPLSSQGVQRSMVSALQAAAVINTVLGTPRNAGLAEEFYRNRLREIAAADCRTSVDYYRNQADVFPTEFWQLRKASGAEFSSIKRIRRSDKLHQDQQLILSRSADQVTTGVLENSWIVPKRALAHPDLDCPVAYLAGYSISALLHALTDSMMARDIRLTWSARMGEPRASYALDWLWAHHILVEADI